MKLLGFHPFFMSFLKELFKTYLPLLLLINGKVASFLLRL